MPLSSTEIAAMNGGYQGMAMNNMAYSNMIGQGGGVYGTGQRGDRAMASAMNTAGAATPIMSGAMGLMGLDPMSLGLRAGMSAYGAGAGAGGAVLAGSAAALPAMVGMAATGYAANQMFEGANNQMALNQQLRGTYTFRNQYGGQGFQRQDMTAIGSMINQMTHQFGPSGEVASFRELTNLTSKMGQMGFAQGIRDVQEFTSRFKEMVKALKTMATDLGTTLEGAMEFAQAAKGSGVFGMNRVQGFAAMTRGATASGLGISEVTSAANIGSQISRSMGGLGRQGAVGGIRTISQIKNAENLGIVSEEDIYNVTGLTGAEGRQAFAASAMQSSARFLRSGRGRRMLASVASNDGTLDENAAMRLVMGDMGIPETMESAQSHLKQVGRANFIRNEGRLRGAALERFGGFLPAMQLTQWARSKNIDINNMDDRSMVFAGRQLHMNRDEVDQAIKMAREMPRILAEEGRAAESDRYTQITTNERRGRGLEGAKRKFEQAKEKINSRLQQAGADIYNAGSEYLEERLGQMFNEHAELYSKDIDQIVSQSKQGGSVGRAAEAKLGIGADGAFSKTFEAVQAKQLFKPRSLADTLNEKSFVAFGTSKADELRELGIKTTGPDGKPLNDQQMDGELRKARGIQQAAMGVDKAAAQAAAGGDFLSTAYAMGKVGGKGPERMNQIHEVIKQKASGDPNDPNTQSAKRMLEQLEKPGITDEQRAGLIGNYERAQGVSAESQLGNFVGLSDDQLTGIRSLGTGGGPATQAEAAKQYASLFGERKQTKEEAFRERLITAGAGVAAGLGVMALTGNPALGIAAQVATTAAGTAYYATESNKFKNEIGAYVMSDKFRDTTHSLFGANKEKAEAERKQLEKDINSQPGDTSGETTVKRRMLAGYNFMKFAEGKNKTLDKLTPEEKAAWAKENLPKGMTMEEVEGTLSAAKTVLTEQDEENTAAWNQRLVSGANKDLERFTRMGVINDKGELAGDYGKDDAAVKDYVQAVVNKTRTISQRDSKDRTSVADIALPDTAKMSVKQKRQAAAKLGGTAEGYMLADQANIEESIRKSRRGREGTISDMLGLGISNKEMEGKSQEEIVQMMADRAGVGDNKELRDRLRNTIKAGGNFGEAAKELQAIKNDPAYQAKQKERREEADKAKNPLLAKLVELTEVTKKTLENIETNSKNTVTGLANLKESKTPPEDKKPDADKKSP